MPGGLERMSSNWQSCFLKVRPHTRLKLMTVPGFQYASLLRDVIQKARRNKLLPPASRPGSPKSGATTVPSWNSQPSTSASSQTQTTDYSKFTFEHQPTELFPALDFSYAEQLLASNGNGPEASTIVRFRGRCS